MKKPLAISAVALLLAGSLTACGPASGKARDACKPKAAASIERVAHTAPVAGPPVIVAPRPVIIPRVSPVRPAPAPAPVRPAPAQTNHAPAFPFFVPFFMNGGNRC